MTNVTYQTRELEEHRKKETAPGYTRRGKANLKRLEISSER